MKEIKNKASMVNKFGGPGSGPRPGGGSSKSDKPSTDNPNRPNKQIVAETTKRIDEIKALQGEPQDWESEMKLRDEYHDLLEQKIIAKQQLKAGMKLKNEWEIKDDKGGESAELWKTMKPGKPLITIKPK